MIPLLAIVPIAKQGIDIRFDYAVLGFFALVLMGGLVGWLWIRKGERDAR